MLHLFISEAVTFILEVEIMDNYYQSYFASVSYILLFAAAAKLLQSCPTLCDPIDGSLPGSSILGILQAVYFLRISKSVQVFLALQTSSLAVIQRPRLCAPGRTSSQQLEKEKGRSPCRGFCGPKWCI